MKNRGHNITLVNESVSCINKCQNNDYDIIFMDFHLNDLNGVETTDLIKNVCFVKSLIFAITGDDSNNAITKFREIGMDGALIKPLDVEIIDKFMNSLEFVKSTDKTMLKLIKNLNIKFKNQLFIF